MAKCWKLSLHFSILCLLLSSDLSWTKHIEGICTKAKKLLGLLYRQFYQHTDQETLLKLYVSHCLAALGVHSTNLRHTHKKDQDQLETTQKFACKITKTGIKATMSFHVYDKPSLADRLYLKQLHDYWMTHLTFGLSASSFIASGNAFQHTATPFTLTPPPPTILYKKHCWGRYTNESV